MNLLIQSHENHCCCNKSSFWKNMAQCMSIIFSWVRFSNTFLLLISNNYLRFKYQNYYHLQVLQEQNQFIQNTKSSISFQTLSPQLTFPQRKRIPPQNQVLAKMTLTLHIRLISYNQIEMIEEHLKTQESSVQQDKTYKILRTVDSRYQIMNILITQTAMESYYVSWDTVLKEVLTAKMISKYAIIAEIQACNDKGKLKDYYFHIIKNEVAVLERYSHENIIKLYNCTETHQHCYQFYQYCPKGSIQAIMAKRGLINYEDVLPYWRQLLRAVCYLHSLGIAHRAIEPRNILVNELNKIKLANFKFAYNMRQTNQMQEILEKSIFMAPELYSHSRVTVKSDVWSLGVTLYYMLYGESPWPNVKEDDWHKRLVTSVRFPEERKVPEKLKMSIERMLIYDPQVRISAKQLAHQFGV